jgi:hypothetical protein
VENRRHPLARAARPLLSAVPQLMHKCRGRGSITLLL